eukprot:74311-Ditylum_brightwellii.AAC.1
MPLPDKLGKCASVTLRIAKDIGFFETCALLRGRNELRPLPQDWHPAAGMLNHAGVHGVPVSTPLTPPPGFLDFAASYGCHSLATADTALVCGEILDQVLVGHIAVFPLSE